MKKFLFLSLLILTSLFANEEKAKTTYVDHDKEIPTYMYGCPALIGGYLGKITNIDFETGTTTCAIFEFNSNQPKESNGDILYISPPVGYETFINPKASKKELMKDKSVNSTPKKFKDYGAIEATIASTQRRIKEQYGNAGASEFVTMSRYVSAIFTFNPTIIDIKKTVEENKLSTTSKYSIYPNDYQKVDREKGFFDTLKKLFSLSNEDVNEKVKEQVEQKSLTEIAVSDKLTYLITFYTKAGHLWAEMATTLLLFMAFFGVAHQSFEAFTKQIQKLQNYENYLEKIATAMIAGTLLWLPTTIQGTDAGGNEYKLQNSAGIEAFQSAVDIGNGWATQLTEVLADTHTSTLSKKYGIFAPSTLQKTINDKWFLENKVLPILEKKQEICTYMFDTNALQQKFGSQVYPLNELIKERSKLLNFNTTSIDPVQLYVKYVTVTAKENTMFRENVFTNQSMAITGCGNTKRKLYETKREIQNQKRIIKNADNILMDVGLQKRVTILAELNSRAVAELGWFAAPVIASTSLMTNMIFFGEDDELISAAQQTEKLSQSRNDGATKGVQKTDNIDIIKEYGLDGAKEIAKILPYKMMPGFNGLEDGVSSIITVSGAFIGLLIPNPVNIVLSKLMKIFKVTKLAATYAAAMIYEEILKQAPLMIVVTIGIVQIVKYAILLLLNTLVMPFVFAWSFARRSTEQLTDFMVRAFVLAFFQPSFIVLTILVSVMSYYLMYDLGVVLVVQQFETLQTVNQLSGDYNNRLILTFTQELLVIVMQVASTILVALLMLTLPSMIMKIFGYKDEDLGDAIVHQIHGKIGKHTEMS